MLAVAWTGLRCWLRYGFPEIRVSVDGVEHHCRGMMFLNGRRFDLGWPWRAFKPKMRAE